MRDRTVNTYLAETEFCDTGHRDVRDMAWEIAGNAGSDREKAVALFYWVRDNVIYRVGHWNRRASETLYEREGTCTNKANLLVAFLRVHGIPAGYGMLRVDGQKYWGPATPPVLAKHVGRVSNHLYAAVYLDRWLAVDPSDDRYLCDNIGYINPTATLLEWDGTGDARIPLNGAHVFEDRFPVENVDFIIRKRPRNVTGIRLSVCNVFIKYLRETKQPFKSPQEVETAFLRHLKSHHPLYYRSLMMASAWKDICTGLRETLGGRASGKVMRFARSACGKAASFLFMN